jgi:mono/diheme cytochrome c family protein
MKTSLKIATIFVTAIIAVVFLFGQAASAQQAKPKPWPVPDKDKAMKAPGKVDAAAGKDLWAKHCKSCHGSKGLGDGPKGASLKTFAGDFSTAAFQAGTDGELFYRTNKGRDEMPGYEKKIPDANDRWALVAYMRTFKK